jgi:hypothetical protein
MADVFISYAHKQFYFAECLMLRLNKERISVWFDALRLVPGTAWRQSIDEELASCSALVLVASGAALASDYVRIEWQTALAAKKPIYVVLFEAVHLPPELKNAAIIDMRTAFETKAIELALAIRRRELPCERLPWTNPFHLPTRLPLRLCFILGTFWLIALMNLAVAVITVQQLISTFENTSSDQSENSMPLLGMVLHGDPLVVYPLLFITIAILIIAILAIFLAFALLFRQHFPYYLLYIVAFSPSFPGFYLLLQSALPVVVALLVLGLEAPALLLPRRSGDFLRWLPTGVAPDLLRHQKSSIAINWKAPRIESQPQKVKKTWVLFYDPSDRAIAEELKDNLKALGPEGTDLQVDVPLALLSNRTREDWLERLVNSAPSLVCIICTSIHIRQTIEKLRQTQWFDYRRATPEKKNQRVDSIPARRITVIRVGLHHLQLSRYTRGNGANCGSPTDIEFKSFHAVYGGVLPRRLLSRRASFPRWIAGSVSGFHPEAGNGLEDTLPPPQGFWSDCQCLFVLAGESNAKPHHLLPGPSQVADCCTHRGVLGSNPISRKHWVLFG